MLKFTVTIFMKNGKKYHGIKEAADQYSLYQVYEEKIKQWKEYSSFQGLAVIPLDDDNY